MTNIYDFLCLNNQLVSLADTTDSLCWFFFWFKTRWVSLFIHTRLSAIANHMVRSQPVRHLYILQMCCMHVHNHLHIINHQYYSKNEDVPASLFGKLHIVGNTIIQLALRSSAAVLYLQFSMCLFLVLKSCCSQCYGAFASSENHHGVILHNDCLKSQDKRHYKCRFRYMITRYSFLPVLSPHFAMELSTQHATNYISDFFS
jgi:hypothetical protein